MVLKPTQIVVSKYAAECMDHITGVQESINDPCSTDTPHQLHQATPEHDSSWQLPGSMRNCARPLKSCKAQVDPCRCPGAAAETDIEVTKKQAVSTQNLHKHYWWCCLFTASWTFAGHRLYPG